MTERETVGTTGQILSWHGTGPTTIVKVLPLAGQVRHSSSETSVDVLNQGLRIHLFVMVIAVRIELRKTLKRGTRYFRP